ncbi:KipI family sensor histidine kinase inhibitor [Aliiruegeria haliotis]|uniref:KipI family sensor histidine kinase inhibitor n=1 Tax=Aliiruegeria haliotis TaxID=1280846 RepID=A0A2T0RTL2_9RHOB|nr:carboxyltransferase domain-containing protein [Aliiruegeria haliotis]PRY24450.1 KipI family sensor histidine kinase inhibitor [Aliiruegeria haliotis]
MTKGTMRTEGFPRIERVGLDGLLVRFADTLSEPANRAALAFRGAMAGLDHAGIRETTSSLAGALVLFDPLALPHDTLEAELSRLLADRDWYAAPLPSPRRLWHVPAVYGGARAPQLDRVLSLVKMDKAEAVAQLSTARLRVIALGFAPGQPYLGQLPEQWDLPRQTDLQTRVPPGAIGLAVRQFVLFVPETQTGWYHIAQTAFRCYRPNGSPAFALQPGDEMVFPAVDESQLAEHEENPDGGATSEVLE